MQQGGDISANSAQFQAASIAGDGPDIRIQYAGGPTISFGQFFEDLEPYLTPEIIDSMSGFNVNREGFSADGAIMGMPYGAGNMFTVFGNNAILEEAGIDPAEPVTSWEQLMENGQQVVDNTDKNAFWVANLEGYVGAWIISALVGGELGETAFTQMYAGEIPVDDPAMLKAYEAFAEFGASGLTNPDAGQVSNGDATAGFVGGQRGVLHRRQLGEQQHARRLRRRRERVVHPDVRGRPVPRHGSGRPGDRALDDELLRAQGAGG